MNRRSFMKKVAVAGASLPLAGALPLVGATLIPTNAFADGHGISEGDAAILRFLAAAELLETDLWQQYNELANGNPAFKDALELIDEDMATYVTQNTTNEFSHADFLNAFLASVHRKPVNLDKFRKLPSSKATGAAQIGRLTNLMHLNVDTSWYLRYRSSGNPDFGDTFPQVVTIMDRPGIPLHDGYTDNQIQAIANTAAFHFPTIEQGGSSLYDAMSLKTDSKLALRIVTNIGGTEVAHFELWHDVVGHIVPVDSGDGLVFTPPPDDEKVLPPPCKFISTQLPLCSVIRPTSPQLAGARAAVSALTNMGLFHGQSNDFFRTLHELAEDADRAGGHGD